MNKNEMTLKEKYDSVLLDIYNNALESIKFVNEGELKKELLVNYIKSLNIILLNALKDDDVIVSDFNYLVSQVYDLSSDLLKIDVQMEVKKNSKGVQRFIAKRKMNSVYGKFATNPNVTPKILYIDTDSIHLVGTQVLDTIKDIIDDKELG